jgi:DUF971 family protein
MRHVADPWPTDLRIRDQGRSLTIVFDTGAAFDLPAELLRVESPSAEVKGHGPGQEQLVWGKRDVAISRAEPVGNYAVRLIFSDGHSTGIFTWPYLLRLGLEQDQIFASYESKLLAAGLKRAP